MNLYKLMRICNKHYSFPSTISLTASLMCFIHFRMSINVQVMPQMSIFLTGNFSTLSRVRRKQQIKKHPGPDPLFLIKTISQPQVGKKQVKSETHSHPLGKFSKFYLLVWKSPFSQSVFVETIFIPPSYKNKLD